MDSATTNTNSPAAEPVSSQEVTPHPFTIYLQSYLTKAGLDEGFIKENITAQVILDSFQETQDTELGPARSLGGTPQLRNSDKVCTDHLQRFLITNGFKPEFAKQVTGPHIIDSILDVMPEELLAKTPNNQATTAPDSTISPVGAPRKDSAFATSSDDSGDEDEDEDLPTKHRRTSRAKFVKDHSRGRITKYTKNPQPKLDLSKNYHEIKTACLACLEVSEDSVFNSNVSSEEYTVFLSDNSLYLARRFASISVTLARAEETKKAAEFGQFGLDLLGPALFNANVVLCEESEEEAESMLFSRMSAMDCIDVISAEWDGELAKEFGDLARSSGKDVAQLLEELTVDMTTAANNREWSAMVLKRRVASSITHKVKETDRASKTYQQGMPDWNIEVLNTCAAVDERRVKATVWTLARQAGVCKATPDIGQETIELVKWK
ncbi:hypothetical protein Slin14017_G080710 [Septoria linicola]|nr:hypothetical protein Slin14017_G080710 [Septoria linicola]